MSQDDADAFEKLDLQRVGVLVGTGMGGLQVLMSMWRQTGSLIPRYSSCLMQRLKGQRTAAIWWSISSVSSIRKLIP